MRVVMNFFEAEVAAQRFKVGIVRVRQRSSQIHAIAATKVNRSVFCDDAFTQRGKCDRKFNSRAGLCAGRKRELLVHHGENASAGGLDGDNGSVHIAKRVNRSLTDNWVFTSGDIAFGDVSRGEGTGGKMLIVVMTAAMQAGAPHGPVGNRTTAMRKMVHAMFRMRSLHYFAGLGGGVSGVDGRGKRAYSQQHQ